MQCYIWASNRVSIQHGDHIADRLFGSTNFLRVYLNMPNVRPLDKVLFRSHQKFSSFPANLEIWFQSRAQNEPKDALNWVDGKDWVWPRNNPALTARERPTKERLKRQKIWDFLNDTSLKVHEVRTGWHVYFGVVGRHAKGGRGIWR
jgi:hypothetical protein